MRSQNQIVLDENTESLLGTSKKTPTISKLTQWFQKPKHSPREELIIGLKKYIDRIESYTPDPNFHRLNYAKGFYIYKNTRALSREANYRLAKKLYIDLTTTALPISEIFKDVNQTRNDLIFTSCMSSSEHLQKRGIRSKELNSILNKAKDFAKKEIINPSFKDSPSIK